MRKSTLPYFMLVLFAFSTIFASCELVGDVFKAGAWFAVIIIVIIVAIVLWIIGKARK